MTDAERYPKEVPFAAWKRTWEDDTEYTPEENLDLILRANTAPDAKRPVKAKPITFVQALMETAPHENPETSHEELALLREVVADAVDRLPPPLCYIVNATVLERRSMRSFTYGDLYGDDHPNASEPINKDRVLRLKKKAISLLQEELAKHPLIQTYLGR